MTADDSWWQLLPAADSWFKIFLGWLLVTKALTHNFGFISQVKIMLG